jgi:hypothetical protein
MAESIILLCKRGCVCIFDLAKCGSVCLCFIKKHSILATVLYYLWMYGMVCCKADLLDCLEPEHSISWSTQYKIASSI